MKYKVLLSLFSLCLFFTNIGSAEAAPMNKHNPMPPHKQVPIPIYRPTKPTPHLLNNNIKPIHPYKKHRYKPERIYRDNKVCINLPGLYISF